MAQAVLQTASTNINEINFLIVRTYYTTSSKASKKNDMKRWIHHPDSLRGISNTNLDIKGNFSQAVVQQPPNS